MPSNSRPSARRKGHKGHPDCEYTSKAACEKARRIAIGQCVSMLDEDHQCPHWGVDTIGSKGYCGQHFGSIFRAAHEETLRVRAKAAMTERIDRALAWHAEHPSVWDPMPLT